MRIRPFALALLPACCIATGAISQTLADERASRPTLSLYGMPGLIDMPSAEMQPDAEASLSFAAYPGRWRSSLGFQFTPWLYVSHQYSYSASFLEGEGSVGGGDLYDRSFGVALRLWDEAEWRPSVVIGINDVAGTGYFAAEYVVASKTIRDRFRLTGGVGWGRLGSYGSFQNPLSYVDSTYETRPDQSDLGGTFQSDEWFRGPAAFFGGVEWAINDKWTAVLEYSSDAYQQEVENAGFERNWPINFGLNYRPRPWIDIGLYSLYGSQIGLMASFSANPKDPPYRGGRESAPPPVSPRNGGTVDLAAWGLPSVQMPAGDTDAVRLRVDEGFAREGLTVEGFEMGERDVRVAFRNDRYDTEPQALGRASVTLAAILPKEIETFTLLPVDHGIAMSAVTIRRSDLEELQFDPDRIWKSYVRADIADAGDLSFAEFIGPSYPHEYWSVRPYLSAAYFDPDQPLRMDAGFDFFASYTPRPGLIFSGNYRAKVLGNRDTSARESDSLLPHVRSDLPLYDEYGSSYLSHLTAEYFFRPGANLYGRATVGYLERMYAGVSTELLWKPVEGPVAFGGELNYVRQRDFEGGFGFRDYEVTTGHLSAYYEFGGGYFGQIDAGRYLAGDYGATLTVSRDFANGVRVGAFATQTDASYEEFGEGSFDKGIFFEIPFSWVAGAPARRGYTSLLRPVQRDGGAWLYVRNRLYQTVKDYHDPDLRERWARFWR